MLFIFIFPHLIFTVVIHFFVIIFLFIISGLIQFFNYFHMNFKYWGYLTISSKVQLFFTTIIILIGYNFLNFFIFLLYINPIFLWFYFLNQLLFNFILTFFHYFIIIFVVIPITNFLVIWYFLKINYFLFLFFR